MCSGPKRRGWPWLWFPVGEGTCSQGKPQEDGCCGVNECVVYVQDQKEEDGPGSGPQGEKELAAKEDLQNSAEDKDEKKEDQENDDKDEDENNEDPKPYDIQEFDEVSLFACSLMCGLVSVMCSDLFTSLCKWPVTLPKWL